MARTGEKGHCSELLLERLLYQVVTAEEQTWVRSHLSSCGGCSDRLAAMEESANLFQLRVYPRTLPVIHQRVSEPIERAGAALILRWAGALVPALALLIVGFVFVPQWFATTGPIQAPAAVTRTTNQAKGEGLMRIYAKRQDSVFLVSDDEAMREGDALRFVPDAKGYSYLLVFSLEASGKLTVFYPYGSQSSGPLAVAPGNPVEGSIILDNSVGQERLWAVFSNRPIHISTARNWLALEGWLSNVSGASAPDAGAAVFHTTIIKEGTR